MTETDYEAHYEPSPSTITPARLAQIKAMQFTTGLNAACGHFDTDVERDLYLLAARCWNALQEVLRDHTHLTNAQAETTARLAAWEGHPDG
ncbi:hypothetical protein ACYSUO_18530 [Streptomyces sp. UC4497]